MARTISSRVDLSLGSTIYRLDTVAVVLLSFVVLHARIGIAKAAGIGLGVLAPAHHYDVDEGGSLVIVQAVRRKGRKRTEEIL